MIEALFGEITASLQQRNIDPAAKDFTRRYGCSLMGQQIPIEDGSISEVLSFNDPDVGFSVIYEHGKQILIYQIRRFSDHSRERKVSRDRLVFFHYTAKDCPQLSKTLLARTPWVPESVPPYRFFAKKMLVPASEEVKDFVLAHVDYAVENFGRN